MKKIKTCSFCGSMRVTGLYILSQWMCSECKEQLLQSNPEDLAYEDQINKIKTAWKHHHIVNKQG